MVVAGVGVAVLVAAGVDGATGAHAVAPLTAAGSAAGAFAKAPSLGIPVTRRPLKGKIVGIDPGHNGRNYTDPSYLDKLVPNGRGLEMCDTTGTATDSGYTEALFNFRVAADLRADLITDGARVVMTAPRTPITASGRAWTRAPSSSTRRTPMWPSTSTLTAPR